MLYSFLILLATTIVASICNWWVSIKFRTRCTDYLARAIDANSIEMAKIELRRIIDYLEPRDLIRGNTSLFIQRPANDINYFYENVAAAWRATRDMPESATLLEQTALLTLIRRSLTDSCIPARMYEYPHQKRWFFVLAALSIGTTITGMLALSHLLR